MIRAAGAETGIETPILKAGDLLAPTGGATNPSAPADLILVLNLDSGDAAALKERLKEIQGSHPACKVLPLDKRAVHVELEKAGVLTQDPAIPGYWRPNGAVNLRRLFGYLGVKYFGRTGTVEPPVLVPDFGFYDPDREESFETLESLKSFRRQHGRWHEGKPVVAVLIQQSFWITHDTKVIDAQVRALERRGMNPVVIFGDTQKQVAKLLRDTRPSLVVEDRHGGMWENGALLQELDVPYLRPVSMLGYTVDEWLADPRGMAHRDIGMFMTLQESWGTLEPVVVGGLESSLQGFRLHTPYASGVERFAQRASAWLNLRGKTNSEKKVAIIYYNKGLGKDDLMRGSPTGGFLDGPESLLRFLPRLQAAGYALTNAPSSVDSLVQRMRSEGHNLGPWMQGELESMVDTGAPLLIPVSMYQKWFESKLSTTNQQAVIKAFGAPPGKIMVVNRHGEPCLVIPRIQVGNVLLMPQPERGDKQDEKLLHSRDVPPPHNYLAFYWWLQEESGVDAVMHWGTHGTLELLPGKENGMTRDCWSDICVGNLPVINLWIMDNLAEATLSRRRSYAQLIDHMVPPAVNAGVSDRYTALHDELDKYQGLEAGLLKSEYRKRIVSRIREEKLDQELRLGAFAGASNAPALHTAAATPGTDLSDEDLEKAAEHIEELFESRTPLTLHVLGTPPEKQYLDAYLVSILGRSFREHLLKRFPPPAGLATAARSNAWIEARSIEFLTNALANPASVPAPTPELQNDVVFAREMLGRLNRADNEIVGLLRALEGRYIQPGPGPEPIRNPSSVPGGRNLYSLNPEEIPTRPSWEVAVQLVDELVRTRHPKKVGMDLNGMETMRDFGVLEAQILYLMGVRPVWDRNNLAYDVELIPRAELKRPRVDVFVAMGGMYKENFPTRVALLDKAVRLAAASPEEDNQVRLGSARVRERLVAGGMPADRAQEFSNARIFGTKPGDLSGSKILYLVPRSGTWEKEDEVADVYIDSMSFVYTKGNWGTKVDGLYEEAIQGTELLVRVWASNMTSQLSNHHAYEYLGGLSMAVKKLTGHEPDALIADVRNPNGAKLRDFQEVLLTSLKSELLNRKWIEGMKSHGYAGAGHAAELVKNTFGWSVTRRESITDSTWNDILSVYMDDKYKLGLKEWFDRENPHALAEIAATMLEAGRTGRWNARPEDLARLARTYAEIVAKHGESGGLVSGGNRKLSEFVHTQLSAPGDLAGAALAAKLAAALEQAAGNPQPKSAKPEAMAQSTPGKTETVTGRKLGVESKNMSAQTPVAEPPSVYLRSLGGIGLALFTLGFMRRKGSL